MLENEFTGVGPEDYVVTTDYVSVVIDGILTMVKLLLLVKCCFYLIKMIRIRNHHRFGCRVSVVQKKYGVGHYFKSKVNTAKNGTMPNSVKQPL